MDTRECLRTASRFGGEGVETWKARMLSVDSIIDVIRHNIDRHHQSYYVTCNNIECNSQQL